MTVVQPELTFVLDEDAATRVAIVDDLGDTMFVEAGAGSGKTKSLVDRVVSLVTRAGTALGPAPPSSTRSGRMRSRTAVPGVRGLARRTSMRPAMRSQTSLPPPRTRSRTTSR